MKLAIPLEAGGAEWLTSLPLPPRIQVCALAPEADSLLPSLDRLVRTLTEERADACLVSGQGPLSRVAAFAADLLGLAVFSLVTTPAQLRERPRLDKPRPDLILLADSALLPLAVDDPRYGSTMLPAGDPRSSPEAAARLVALILRWDDGALAPERPDLSVIVPAYKESHNLDLVVERLLASLEPAGIGFEILLVDDGSPDDTYQTALRLMWRSPRVRALTKPAPRGMGASIRHGLGKARAELAAVTMGDGSDDVARIPEMFRKVHDEGFALAIGSRYGQSENYRNVPWLYRFWSRIFRLAARAASGAVLLDYTNAFRLFHRRIFAPGGPESLGFEISPEITFKAWFRTRKIAEVDVKHLKRTSGQSNFSFLRAGPGYARMLLKALLNRITGRWFTLGWYLNLEREEKA